MSELPVMTAAEIAGIYRRVIAGEGRINRSVSAGGLTVIDVDGARVCVAFDLTGNLQTTLSARAPGRERWSYGCERNWAELGPPIDPLAMVDQGALGKRLWAMEGLPLMDECAWPDFGRVGMRQQNVSSFRRKQKRGNQKKKREQDERSGHGR
jgi:hypothetical protein